jgi:hypothetical protein
MVASYPGLPEELMRIGLVIVTVRAHDAHIAAYPADFAGVRCKLPGQTHGPAAAAGSWHRATTIAAAPGRRQQQAPALIGVG